MAAIACAQGLVFGVSCLFEGFYDFSLWGPLSLVSFALLTAVVLARPVELSRPAAVALSGLALLLLWSALSMTWAASVDAAWTEVNRAAFYLATLACAVLAIRSTRSALTVFGLLTIASSAVSLYVLVRMLTGSGPELFLESRLNEPLGYINGEAAFFLMGFWPLVAYAERLESAWLRGVALGLATVTASLLVLTQSRAVIPALVVSTIFVMAIAPGRIARGWALLAAVAGVAAALPWLLDVYAERPSALVEPDEALVVRAALATLIAATAVGITWAWASARGRRVRDARPKRAAAVALVAVPLIAAGLVLTLVDRPFSRLHSEYRDFVELRVDPNVSERFTTGGGYRYDLWRIALNQFVDDPLRGVGAGNYATTFYAERRHGHHVRQPHSLELQMLGELGVVGGLALLLFIGGILATASFSRWGGVARTEPLLLVAASGVFVVWLTQTSVDWVYNLPGLTGIALLAAGTLLGRPEQPDPAVTATQRGLLRRKLTTVACIACLAVLAASVGRQYAADWYRERAERSLAEGRPDRALADARTSRSLNGASISTRYLQAAALARRNDYTGARRALLDAARLEPFNYVPWALLGDLAVRRGDLRVAARAYRRSSRLNPYERSLRMLADKPESGAR